MYISSVLNINADDLQNYDVSKEIDTRSHRLLLKCSSVVANDRLTRGVSTRSKETQ